MSQHIFENSKATYEPLSLNMLSGGFSFHFQYNLEWPSSSVTLVGNLWQQAMVNTENNELFLAKKDATSKSVSQRQKNADLLRLLNSWREGDEQEQCETLEYLRKSLDEDRFSNRKLFP